MSLVPSGYVIIHLTKEIRTIVDYVDINPDAGANRTLLLVHGWPGLWSIWSNQIQHFQNKYRLIIPDLRGFGDSTHPGDVQASGSYSDLVGDLVCVMEKAGAQNVVCIGHDWGSQICHEAARMRPDLFQGVVGAALPVSLRFLCSCIYLSLTLNSSTSRRPVMGLSLSKHFPRHYQS